MDYMCRTCLATCGELVPIFSKEYYVKNLPMKLMKTTKIKISENDYMPKMMCKKCIFLVDSLYCFKDQCEMADLKLKGIVQAPVLDDTAESFNISLPTLTEEHIFNEFLGINSDENATYTKTRKDDLNTVINIDGEIENEYKNSNVLSRMTRSNVIGSNLEYMSPEKFEMLKNVQSCRNIKFETQYNDVAMDVDTGSYQDFVKNEAFSTILHSSLDNNDECDKGQLEKFVDQVDEGNTNSDDEYIVEYISEEARLEVENAQRRKNAAKKSNAMKNNQRSKGIKVISVEILPAQATGNILENYVLAKNQRNIIEQKVENFPEPQYESGIVNDNGIGSAIPETNAEPLYEPEVSDISDKSPLSQNSSKSPIPISSTSRKHLHSLMMLRRKKAQKKKLSFVHKRKKSKVKHFATLSASQRMQHMSRSFSFLSRKKIEKWREVKKILKNKNSGKEGIQKIEQELLSTASNQEPNDPSSITNKEKKSEDLSKNSKKCKTETNLPSECHSSVSHNDASIIRNISVKSPTVVLHDLKHLSSAQYEEIKKQSPNIALSSLQLIVQNRSANNLLNSESSKISKQKVNNSALCTDEVQKSSSITEPETVLNSTETGSFKRKMSKSDEDLEKMLSEDVSIHSTDMEENAATDFLKQIQINYPHKCEMCSEQQNFKTYAELLAHNTKYHSKDPQQYDCSLCHQVFDNKKFLQIHLDNHSKSKLFKCPMCLETFSTERRLSVHVTCHISEDRKCKLCLKQYVADSALHEHYCFHAGVSSQWCNLLESRIKKNKSKGDKQPVQDTQQPVNQCQKSIKDELMKDLTLSLLKCPKCLNLFSEQDLPKHMLEHTSSSPFLCPYCDKAFQHQVVLQDHVNFHLGIIQFTCLDCGEIFGTPEDRKKHMLDHGQNEGTVEQNKDDFKCKLCNVEFNTESDYSQHHNDYHISSETVMVEQNPNVFYAEPDIEYLTEEVTVNTEES